MDLHNEEELRKKALWFHLQHPNHPLAEALRELATQSSLNATDLMKLHLLLQTADAHE